MIQKSRSFWAFQNSTRGFRWLNDLLSVDFIHGHLFDDTTAIFEQSYMQSTTRAYLAPRIHSATYEMIIRKDFQMKSWDEMGHVDRNKHTIYENSQKHLIEPSLSFEKLKIEVMNKIEWCPFFANCKKHVLARLCRHVVLQTQMTGISNFGTSTLCGGIRSKVNFRHFTCVLSYDPQSTLNTPKVQQRKWNFGELTFAGPYRPSYCSVFDFRTSTIFFS